MMRSLLTTLTAARLALLGCVLLYMAACSGSTGPKTITPPPGIDPSLLVINQSPDTVRAIFVSDQTGSMVTDTVRVAPGATVCTRWTQTFDSLYTRVVDSLPNASGSYSSVTTPWVHFAQYPDYFQRVVVSPFESMLQTIDQTECQ